MCGRDAASCRQQIADIARDQTAIRNIICPIPLYKCSHHTLTRRVMDINRVTTSSDQIVELSSCNHIHLGQRIMPNDSSGFTDTNLRRYCRDRSPFKSRHITLQNSAIISTCFRPSCSAEVRSSASVASSPCTRVQLISTSSSAGPVKTTPDRD